MRTIAVISCAAPTGYALASAIWGRRELDIEVYLMGARHVASPGLYGLRLPHVGLYFTYPPVAGLIFTPLTIFPLRVAEALWGCVNVAALVLVLYATIRAIEPAGDRQTALWSAAIMTGPSLGLEPVLSTFSLGQVDLVVVALVLLDLTASLSIGRLRLGRGILLGVASAVKLTPLIFVPWLFLTRQVRAGWTAVATFACGTAVGLAVSPTASWRWWTTDVFKTSRVGGLLYISNQDLRIVVERFHHAAVSGLGISSVVALVGAGGLGLAVVAFRRSSELLGVLVCATTGLVVSPVTWSHHLVWVVPIVVWLAAGNDRPALGPVIATATWVLFWIAPIYLVPHEHNRELRLTGWQLVVGNSFFFAMCGLLLGVAVLLVTRRAVRTTPPAARGSDPTAELTGPRRAIPRPAR